MKIVQINSVCGEGSTGRICVGIAEAAQSRGHECKIAYGRRQADGKFDEIGHRINDDFGVKVHALKSRLFGKSGSYSVSATKKFLAWLDEYAPDILHLHNLHGYYLNFPLLFDYIKEKRIRTVWTLHDCWAFTGHCAYFDMANCDKWKDRCGKCVQAKDYPKSFVDDSRRMFNLKKACFLGVEDMTIVTPSHWLAGLVGKSFLKEYTTQVIFNGLNLDNFCPTEGDIRKRLGLENKRIVLGVAFQWGARKGLDVFVELSQKLSDNYRIILVGVEQETAKNLPQQIITVTRTNSQSELAEYYTAADVFVNPTREDNFPTVNLEALACGTPVITFDTGGSSEMLDSSCGIVVAKNDTDELSRQIKKVCENGIFASEACLKRAKQFDAKDLFDKYVDIYERIN